MDSDTLHKKLMASSQKNKKALSLLVDLIRTKKKEERESQSLKYQNYRKQYEELLRFNKQSQEQNYRLKKELALVDIEIEELSYRNKLSRSRIKDQNDQISNIKDETFDIDKQKKKENQMNKQYQELKEEQNQLQEEISSIEANFDLRRKTYYELQEQYHQKRIKKEYLFKLHKQNQQKNQEKTDQLQAELKSLRNEISQLTIQKEREEKTKRNTRNIQCLNEIKEMVQFHKLTYERETQ